MAHLEGVIREDETLEVVCEKCGKFVATILNPKKDIVEEDAKKLIDYISWLENKFEGKVTIGDHFSKCEESYTKLYQKAQLS